MEPAIGIDLGTVYSRVVVFHDDGVETIAIPSIVAFTRSERLVGHAAKDQIATNPQNTIFDTKRLIGRRFGDTEMQSNMKDWPSTVVDRGTHSALEVDEGSETIEFTPEEISAIILTKMMCEIAKSHIGRTITNADAVTVITVPADFNDSQRQATLDAGRIAGLTNPRLLNEASATALAYGVGQEIEEGRHVLVFDLGGGTCDVSLLGIQNGAFQVIATAGDTHLGGRDFDQCLLRHMLRQSELEHRKTISPDPQALCRLRIACEEAKCALSSQTETSISLEALVEGVDLHASITREEFEDLCKDLFRRAEGLVEQVLQDADMDKSAVHEVVLAGGSTRIPGVQEIFSSFAGKQLTGSVGLDRADEAVAYGAAVQAAVLQRDVPSNINQDTLLIDVAPFTVGIEAADGAMTTLIKRNTIIPMTKSMVFDVHSNNLPLKIFKGERYRAEDNNLLYEFKYTGIPSERCGMIQIEVTFEVDANGIITLSAAETGSSKTKMMTISSDSRRILPEEIDRMPRQAKDYERAEGQADHI